MRYPAFVAEMAAPANRPRLRFGIWAGYVIVLGFAALAGAAAAFDVMRWQWAFAILIGCKLATNSLALACLGSERWLLPTQALNTFADVVLLTGAVYFTGGPNSPLVATYVIIVTALSLLSNLTITLLMAVLMFALFSVMMMLLATGVLPPMPVPGHPGEAPSMGFALTAIVYCVVVIGVPAWFSTATLRQLKKKEDDLEARTAQLIQLNTQRSQFIASMTHELRTPIHGVQGLADVIAAGVYGPVTDKQKEACASIKRSAQSLLGLVDDVLNLARAEANRIEARPRPLNVAVLVERVTASVSWMIGTKQIQLEATVEPDLPHVQTDDRWLAHVLVNLVSNAVKFTPEGGRIVVRAYAHPARDAVVLAVEDTGIGIAPEDRERIFEPFRQGESSDEKGYGGVGLGLALVAKLTELLGAEVELDSEVGKGSTFRVIVPVGWKGRPASRIMRAVNPPA